MDLNERIKFTNTRGDEISFNTGEEFFSSNINGLGDLQTTIQGQQSPYQDGYTYIESNLEARFITFDFTIFADNETELSKKRESFGKIFNPNLGLGILEYTSGDITRIISSASESVPRFNGGLENRSSIHQTGSIALVCPNPFWRSKNERVEQLVTFSGGLSFPLILPTIFGNQEDSDKSRIIVNEGNYSSPLEITFEGPATSPIRIENETTGKFIEVNQSLLLGEELRISTAFGNKKVQKVATDGTITNAFNYIIIESSFFNLEPGNNLLTYSTGAEFEKAPVTIKFYPRYLAV